MAESKKGAHLLLKPRDDCGYCLTPGTTEVYVDGVQIHGVKQVTFALSANRIGDVMLTLHPASVDIKGVTIQFETDGE